MGKIRRGDPLDADLRNVYARLSRGWYDRRLPIHRFGGLVTDYSKALAKQEFALMM